MVLGYLGRGIIHELAGTPCQDAISGCRARNGSLILVLSDGASSARCGGEAARSIADTVTGFFCRMPLAEFLALPRECAGEMILEECNGELRKLAEELGEPELRHFSATLVFAVLTDDALLVGHLGDGMALALDGGERVIMHSLPERNAAEGNATWFTVSSDVTQHLRLTVVEQEMAQIGLVAMASDGLMEMLAGRGDGNPAETIRELLGYICGGELCSNADLAEILNQMAEVTDERMDDWSMVLWSPAGDFEEFPLGGVCRSMLREEEEKYQISEHWSSGT